MRKPKSSQTTLPSHFCLSILNVVNTAASTLLLLYKKRWAGGFKLTTFGIWGKGTTMWAIEFFLWIHVKCLIVNKKFRREWFNHWCIYLYHTLSHSVKSIFHNVQFPRNYLHIHLGDLVNSFKYVSGRLLWLLNTGSDVYCPRSTLLDYYEELILWQWEIWMQYVTWLHVILWYMWLLSVRLACNSLWWKYGGKTRLLKRCFETAFIKKVDYCTPPRSYTWFINFCKRNLKRKT